MTTPTQSAIGFPHAANTALGDLKAIWQRLPTMHDEGWSPKQPNHDRPTPPIQAGVGVDDVPGPTWDCGQGDHRVRQGWERMIAHLETAQTAQAAILEAILPLRGSLYVVVCRPTSNAADSAPSANPAAAASCHLTVHLVCCTSI